MFSSIHALRTLGEGWLCVLENGVRHTKKGLEGREFHTPDEFAPLSSRWRFLDALP